MFIHFYLKFSYNFISLYFVHETVNSGASQDKIYWSHSYHSSQKSSFVEPVAIREPCLSQHQAISTTDVWSNHHFFLLQVPSILSRPLYLGGICAQHHGKNKYNKCVYIYISQQGTFRSPIICVWCLFLILECLATISTTDIKIM